MVKKPPAKKTVFRNSKDGQFVRKIRRKHPVTIEKERHCGQMARKKSSLDAWIGRISTNSRRWRKRVFGIFRP
ncbi:hypothetical protein ACWGS9_28960 [Bradyrhizobium sp. Arg314]